MVSCLIGKVQVCKTSVYGFKSLTDLKNTSIVLTVSTAVSKTASLSSNLNRRANSEMVELVSYAALIRQRHGFESHLIIGIHSREIGSIPIYHIEAH